MASGLALTLLITTAAVGQDDAEVAPIEPLPVTPSQAEGPFYPLEIPPDRDSDLTVVVGADALAQGTSLFLDGRLLRSDGSPIADATVEIWQTDSQGIYLHPDDPGFADLDLGFQGYGESVTDADGIWSFSTILPNIYGNRPRHIHAKVRIDGDEVLTTQIYFVDGGEGLAGAVAPTGTELDALMVALEPTTRADGEAAFTAAHTIVLE